VVLPGLMVWGAGLAGVLPAGFGLAGTFGLVAALAAVAGLVLTQGRAEKGVAAKAITGVVSLYGILGSYGIVGFFSDVLSYSRLLALGLATSIIGLAVNVMAGIVRDLPGIGLVAFLLVLVIGHIFNFAMSILGSFVHPARLIMLEFFSRFYESGGREFRPLAPRVDRVELVGPGSA
jgi:V/A-type H+-transporting ATPase subunit I